jgi:hypothetical protein
VLACFACCCLCHHLLVVTLQGYRACLEHNSLVNKALQEIDAKTIPTCTDPFVGRKLQGSSSLVTPYGSWLAAEQNKQVRAKVLHVDSSSRQLGARIGPLSGKCRIAHKSQHPCVLPALVC